MPTHLLEPDFKFGYVVEEITLPSHKNLKVDMEFRPCA
jgi:hypothetical protein